MAFKDVFHDLRLKSGYTQKALSEVVGVSPQALQNWEYGRALPRPDKLKPLADALGVSQDYLISLMREERASGTSLTSTVHPVLPSFGRKVDVPLLSREVTACCGTGIPMYDEVQGSPEKMYSYTITELGGRYDEMRPPVAVYADGACLERSRIQDGDILVINPALEPRHLQICVVIWRGALSAKRVSLNPDGSVDLRSDFDTYHIDAKEAADPDQFAIWGPVVEVRHGLI